MATSLDVYLPFDAGTGANVTEDSWRKMARFWMPTGPLRGEDNELLVYGDSSGMQAKVKTGKLWIQGHYGEVTAERTLAIASASGMAGGQSRYDVVIARADFVNNRIELDVVTGTPGTPGTVPGLTTSASMWEIPLAIVGPLTNATVTIAAGSVIDTRLFAIPGSLTGYLEAVRVVGAAGQPALTAAWTAFSAVGFWFCQATRMVHLQGIVQPTGDPPALSPVFTLPTGYRPAVDKFLTSISVVGGVYTATGLQVTSAGVVTVVNNLAAGVQVYFDGLSFRV